MSYRRCLPTPDRSDMNHPLSRILPRPSAPSVALSTLALALCVGFAPIVRAQVPAPAPVDKPYPGILTLQVDATDLDRRIFRIRESVPVKPGPLALSLPLWKPGNHGPSGGTNGLAGLQMSVGGKPVAWTRDTLDANRFLLTVPPGASTLDIEFQSLTPVRRESGRVVVTPEMLNLQWITTLLYPAAHWDRQVTVKASVRVPEGWKVGTALETATQSSSSAGALFEFKPVTVETLLDSPIYSGKHMNRVDLDPEAKAAGRAPVFLNVMADAPEQLEMKPDQLAAHRALVAQADKLYGTRHYAHYDFLLSLSDQMGGIGLEHHQSSENGVAPTYFTEWSKSSAGRDLLAHEYTHSWNGKFRRPADLWVPNNNVAMQDSLLWVYEGQTQFWGYVLAARSGLVSVPDAIDTFATLAAAFEGMPGRAWRNLQDTTNAPVMGARGATIDWPSWQRTSDYYQESSLVWLEADMKIRELSGGARSMDDFARAFFGVEPGRVAPLTYTFDQLVATLNSVQPYGWAAFLRERLDTHAKAPLDGLAMAGWKLAWSEEPSAYLKAATARRRVDDFNYSLGLTVAAAGRLAAVRWESPAFQAGITIGDQLLAVNGRTYKAEAMAAAIKAAKTTPAPIQLLLKNGEVYRTVSIDYNGGLRYPKLERIEGVPDRLTTLLTAKP